MTKNETEKLSDFLRDNEISADYYHAGMTKNIKQNVQAAWLEEKIHVVCATIAYGTLSLTQSLSVSLSLDLTRPLSLPLSLGARDGNRQAQCAVRHSRLIGEELRGILSGEATARPPPLSHSLNQEAGRAGRDGQRSDCILLYRPSDVSALERVMLAPPKRKLSKVESER
jgi:hypothetical protein